MIDNRNRYQSNFEKLEVWKKSHKLVIQIYEITKSFPKDEKYGLIDQLRRSASSVPTNIAEGNEKKSKKEFIQFLFTAKGSLAETKYHLILARDLNYISQKNFDDLLNQINEIGRLLNGLIKYLSSMIHHPSSNYAFTLMELLIVIALIALLGVAALALINPKKQLEKAWDGKRKHELSTLKKVFEDFYNDKNFYPVASDVCYDNPEVNEEICSCYLCGRETNQSSFSPYLDRLPCDPQYPQRKYFYQYECNSKQWYKLCAILSENSNGGSYNYAVSSENAPSQLCPILPACPPDPAGKYCLKRSDPEPTPPVCNICGEFANCLKPVSCDQPVQLYKNSQCQKPCQ